MARIERLERLLTRAQAQVQSASEEVSGIVARERRNLQWLDSSRALNSSSPMDSRFARALRDCRTGCVLDANGLFFDVTGFTPGSLLQRRMDPYFASPQNAPLDVPLVHSNCQVHSDSGGGSSPRKVQWVPTQRCRQYPATERLLEELLAGQLEHFRAPLRCRWADGHTYEIKAHVWVTEAEWAEEADGSRWRRPSKFMCAAAIDEYCMVEEDCQSQT